MQPSLNDPTVQIEGKSLISVIVPVYNVESYLERCINSILIQDYSKLELILVDDGSTDRSWEICRGYKKTDSRITIIQQPNSGSSVARNTGLKLSQGDYIAFVDSDDWIHKQMLSTMLSFAREHLLQVVECGLINSTSSYEKDNTKDLKGSFIETQEQAMGRLLEDNNFSVWRRIYSSDLIDGLQFIPGKIHQDVFFTIDVINRIDRQGYIPLKFYTYNTENESVIRSAYSKKKLDAKDALYYIVDQTKSYNCTVKRLANNYLLTGLVNHYNPLFSHSYLDPDRVHRKTIRKEIKTQLSFKNKYYSFLSVLAAIMPIWAYGLFWRINLLRIKLQLTFLKSLNVAPSKNS